MSPSFIPRLVAIGMNPVYTPARNMMMPTPAIAVPSNTTDTAVHEYFRNTLWNITKNVMSGINAYATLIAEFFSSVNISSKSMVLCATVDVMPSSDPPPLIRPRTRTASTGPMDARPIIPNPSMLSLLCPMEHIPIPSARRIGTVTGPVVTPPESNAMPMNSVLPVASIVTTNRMTAT